MGQKETKKILELDNPELIASLLYAAIIGAMFSYLVQIKENEITSKVLINTVLLIILVFTDWNNRVFVPASLINNNKNQKFWKSIKLFIEVIGMVLLITFYRHFIIDNESILQDINIYTVFAIYLILTGIWNLIVISLMDNIELKKLFFNLFKVISFIEGLDKILSPKKVPNSEYKISDYVEKIQKKDDTILDNLKHIKNKIVAKLPSYKNNTKIFIIQFIGNHLIWFNTIIGVILLLFGINISKYIQIKIVNFYIIDKYTLLFLTLLLILLFLLSKFEKNLSKYLFGISFSLFMFLGYILFMLIFGIDILFYVVILQQILIGFIIEYMTDGTFFS